MKGRNLGVRVGANYTRTTLTSGALEHFPKPGWYEVDGIGGGGSGSGGNNNVELPYTGEGGGAGISRTDRVFLSSSPQVIRGAGRNGGAIGGGLGGEGGTTYLRRTTDSSIITSWNGGRAGVYKSTDPNYRGREGQLGNYIGGGGGDGGISGAAAGVSENGGVYPVMNYKVS